MSYSRRKRDDRPQGLSDRNNGTTVINPGPVSDTDETNCAECSKECVEGQRKENTRSSKKKPSADIVECSKHTNEEIASHGPNSNKKNADKVYLNVSTTYQDANEIDEVSQGSTVIEESLDNVKVMPDTGELKTEGNSVEANPKREAVNNFIPPKGDHDGSNYDENISNNVGYENSAKISNTVSGKAANMADQCSNDSYDSHRQKISSTSDFQNVKDDHFGDENRTSVNVYRNAKSTDNRELGEENELELRADADGRRFCSLNQNEDQSCLKIKKEDGSNPGITEHLSKDSEKSDAANHLMPSKSINIQMIKQVTVKLSKDWLNAMGNDCAMLHNLSSKYNVRFNEDKQEISGNMDDLRCVREILNQSASKQFSNNNCVSEECNLIKQGIEIKTNDLLTHSHDQKLEISSPTLQPSVPPRTRKTKPQGEVSINESSGQEVAQLMIFQDKTPKKLSEKVSSSERHELAGAVASGGPSENEVPQITAGVIMNRVKKEGLRSIQCIAGAQPITCNIRQQYSKTIEFDNDVYEYIYYAYATEIMEIKKVHGLKLQYKNEKCLAKLDITANSSVDVDESVGKLMNIIQRVTKFMIMVPLQYLSQAKFLDSEIRRKNTRKDVGIELNEAQDMWKILGSHEGVEKTEKWISQFIPKVIHSNRIYPDHPHALRSSTNSQRGAQAGLGIDMRKLISVVYQQPQRGQNALLNAPIAQSNEQSHKFDISTFSIISGISTANQLIFTINNPNHVITVCVERRDMLQPCSNGKLLDAIVSPCDKELSCQKGLSKAIMDAAGPSVRKLCDDKVRNKKYIAETQHFVTVGGSLSAQGLKYIMHAVGPNALVGNKNSAHIQKMTSDTYYNCFTAPISRQISSMALPLLGAGIYQVPIDTIVRALLAALQRYSTHLIKSSQANWSLKNIYIVCNDLETINLALQEFGKSIHSTNV